MQTHLQYRNCRIRGKTHILGKWFFGLGYVCVCESVYVCTTRLPNRWISSSIEMSNEHTTTAMIQPEAE